AIVELLDDPWYPAHAALGDDDLELRVPLEDAPGEQVDERVEELLDEHLGMEEGGAGAALVLVERIARLGEDGDVEREDDSRLLEQVEQRLPAFVFEARLCDGDLQVSLADASLFGETLELVVSRLGIGWQHRDPDQPLGRDAAEVLVKPVVVGRIAGAHERLVVGPDRGNGAEHEMAPDVVAIHVLQPEMWMTGAQLGRVLDPAAVVGGVDRLRAVAE